MENVVRTSDRVDRVHGRWELDNDNIPVCSVCGEVAPQRLHYSICKHIYDIRYRFTRFCPECGARLENTLPAMTEQEG